MAEEKDLKSKVEKWINSEGLSLEYFTSLAFMKMKFRTLQSEFVDDNGTPREIDVLAYKDYNIDDTLLRLSCVLECKWSKDKPWIIFTSENSKMAPSASVAQSLGNETGSALLWLLAGEEKLYETKLYDKEICGFSGRQSFSKDSDLFYSTIQSTINKTIIDLNEYNKKIVNPLNFIAISFPIIVIDAPLFESYFEDDQVKVKEVSYSTLNWRGSNKWKFNASVRIVTKEYLPEWVENLNEEFDLINEISRPHINNLKLAYSSKNLELLKPKECARGMIGIPSFLNKIKYASI